MEEKSQSANDDEKSRLPFPIAYPRYTLILCLIVTLSIFMGAQYLKVSTDTRIFAGRDNVDLKRLEQFETVFSQNNNILIALHANEGDVFTFDRIRTIHELTEKAWTLPHAIRVDSITNYPFLSSTANDIGVKSLSPFSYDPENEGLSPAVRLAEFRDRVADEELLQNWLVSEDRATTALNINFQIPKDATAEVAEIMAAVRALVADTANQESGALQPHITGNIALMSLFAEAAAEDSALLTPIAFLTIGLMVVIFFRFSAATLFILSAVLMATLVSVGIAGWSGRLIDPGFSAAPVIVMILSLANGVHFTIVTQKFIDAGLTSRAAVHSAARETFFPIFLAAASTSIGFFVLNFADSPSFHRLAEVVTAGVVAGFLLCFTWIAAGLTLFPISPSKNPDTKKAFLSGLADFLNRHPGRVLLASVVLTVVILAGLFRSTFDADFVRYFDERYDYRRASDFVEQKLTGLNLVEFGIDSGQADGIKSPEYLQAVDHFSEWLKTNEKVVYSTTVADTIKLIGQHMSETKTSEDSLPKTQEEIAQFLLLYELSLPQGLDLRDRISSDSSSTRVTAILRGATSKDITQLNDDAERWMAANFPEQMRTMGVSINVVFAESVINNVRPMIGATFVALLIISAIIFLALRNLRLGAIGTITNVLPIAVGFGLWGYLDGYLDLVAAAVPAITLGLIVDDTIHFLVKYKRAIEIEKKNPLDAVKYAYDLVGKAIVITSVSLIVGFLVLTTSGFEFNKNLGLFTSLIIIGALFVDLIILPALLLWLNKLDTRSTQTAAR